MTVPGAVSEAVAASATAAPRRSAPAAGAVSEPIGRVRSIVIRTSSAVCLPALSVARTRRRRGPSDGIAHEAWYGAPVSTPSSTHESETQAGESSAHWSKRTLAMPLPASVAVARHGGRVGGREVDRVGRDDRERRGGVVDRDRDRRRRERVAGVVGGHDAEVVVAVDLGGRVPARRLARPGADARRRALEDHGGDAGAAGVGGVAREHDASRRRRRRSPAP